MYPVEKWAAATGLTLEEEERAIANHIARLESYPSNYSVQNVNPILQEHLKALRIAIKKKNSD